MNDLIDLLHHNNHLTRPFGVNIYQKVNHRQHKRNYRIYILLSFLWLETIYTSMLSLIPMSNEGLLLMFGDQPFMLVNKNRYPLYPVVILYRISSASMVTLFYLNDFSWLSEANKIFARLQNPQLYDKLLQIKHRIQLVMFIVICIRVCIILTSNATAAFVLYHDRNSKYFMIQAYVMLISFALIYTSINCQFMAEFYLLSQVCIQVFKSINSQYCNNVRNQGHPFQSFSLYYSQFNDACILAHHIISYIRPIYVIYFACNVVANLFLLYMSLFKWSMLFLKITGCCFVLIEITIVIFFSNAIGCIETNAKDISDKVYCKYIIKLGSHRQSKLRITMF